MSIGGYRRSDVLRGAAIPSDVLRALPKTDLHVHLDGSLRLATLIELGRAAGLEMPDDPAAEHEWCLAHTTEVMQTAPALTRITRELVADFAADGVWWVEVRFCPLLHTEQRLTPEMAVAAVVAGLREGCALGGIDGGVILSAIRTLDPQDSLELAELAVAWRDRGVVGFDLAGTEADHPASKHRDAFYHVMNHNQNVTVHAGEGYGAVSIHQALHRCGANRIGHGARLEEDPDLMAYVADHRIPLEICLSSNVQSGVVVDLAHHPLRHFLSQGLRVCLNTDNTLLAGTSPLRELRLAVDAFDLTLLETENLLLDGFKSAFMPAAAKGVMVMAVLQDFVVQRDAFRLDEQGGAQ